MATYSKEKNAIFYHIPKCAGLYVESILRDECDFITYNFISQARISFYWNYKKSIREEFWKNSNCFLIPDGKMEKSFEFTFVRNPYTRFISAYFYCKSKGFDDPDIIKSLQDLIDNINAVSYTTFFHIFKTQYQNIKCNKIPNGKPMDHIGKFETLHEDIKIIYKRLKLPPNYSKVKVNESPVKYGDYRQYYTPEILDFVNTHFKDDFEQFNYEMVSSIENLPI